MAAPDNIEHAILNGTLTPQPRFRIFIPKKYRRLLRQSGSRVISISSGQDKEEV